MNQKTLVLSFLGVVALGFIAKGKGILDFADNLRVYIVKVTNIKISGSFVEFLVSLKLDNNSNQESTIDRLLVTLFISDGDKWEIIGSTEPDVKAILLKANASTFLKVSPRLSIVQLLLNVPLSTLFQQKIKVETRITAFGTTTIENKIIPLKKPQGVR